MRLIITLLLSLTTSFLAKASSSITTSILSKQQNITQDTLPPSQQKGLVERQPKLAPDLPIEPLEEPQEPKQIFIGTITETMPRFPGCEDLEGSTADKKSCSDQKLIAYIYENISYSNQAQ